MHLLSEKIIKRLPYSAPFLFVEGIDSVDSERIAGFHTFNKDDFFYSGHFVNEPVTPGVILLETMGQIGLVSFGIYLFGLYENTKEFRPLLSWLESDFYKVLGPGERVSVVSEKVYLRKTQLKCRIQMFDKEGDRLIATTATCRFEIF